MRLLAACLGLTLVALSAGCGEALLPDAAVVVDAAMGCGDACGCSSDFDCGGAAPRCDLNTRRCVACLPEGDNCPQGQRCVASNDGYACAASCTTAIDCGRSDGGVQLNCCSGACIDTSADTQACGACGHVCTPPPNAEASCQSGTCAMGACNAGFLDCDGRADSGCEVVSDSDPKNCGACNTVCRAGPNQSMECRTGACVPTCATGFAHCSANPTDGCEVDTRGDVKNCGGCNRACPARANADSVCQGGACQLGTCQPGFGDCNKQAVDGCEADFQNDSGNCGRCGQGCQLANASSSCTAGRCTVSACNPGFTNCDAVPDNGCETNIDGDPRSCGACGHVCIGANSVQGCQAGQCTVASCQPGFTDCNGKPGDGCEVATGSDLANCGGCGVACAAPPNGVGACRAGACVIAQCSFGFADCNNKLADGCEVDLLSLSSCGSCGNVCPVPANATAGCRGGICGVGMCNALFGDCDNNAANGCEKSLAADVANCGRCGSVCTVQNGAPTCAQGACSVLSCNMGFADCDAKYATGCEVNTQTDAANCGGCGKACAQGLVCQAGSCTCAPCNLPNASAKCVNLACAVDLCNAGWADCDNKPANGCEASTISDPANCGKCGVACPMNTPFCVAGVCVASTHNTAALVPDYNTGYFGCGDNSDWWTQNFGSMTWDACETLANKYGAQYMGQTGYFAGGNFANCPYQNNVRWVGEADVNNGFISSGSWNVVSTLAKNANQNCVLAYANQNKSGNGTFNTTMVSNNGRSYLVSDFGVISERTCYNNANAAGARPLNPFLFANATKTTAHMVENHQNHGSVEYNGLNAYTSDGGCSHTYRCFVGYNP